MARIAGVDLPLNKRVEIGLTYIYGIGRPKANFILEKADVRPDTRVKDLSEEEVVRIRKVITDDVKVEGDLRKDIAVDIKRLMDIGCYRGHAAPPQPAGARPAHAHQRPDPQGPAQADDRRQEEGDEEVTLDRGSRGRTWLKQHRSARRPEKGAKPAKGKRARTAKKEKKNIPHASATVAGVLQQHDRLDRGPGGQHPRLVVGRAHRVQGLAQGHAVRGPARRGQLRRARQGARRALGGRPRDRARAPAASRRSARSQANGIDIKSIKDTTPIPHNGCRPRKRRRV